MLSKVPLPGSPGDPASVFANPDFLRLWLGQVVSSTGFGVSRVAMPLLVLALTGSPAQAGLVAATLSVPYLAFGLVAGALIDRWDRRRILIACDVAQALAVGSVPLAWALGALIIAQLYAVALVQGSAWVFKNIGVARPAPPVRGPGHAPVTLRSDAARRRPGCVTFQPPHATTS